MGPIFWVDDAPKDEPICKRGRVAFSGPELDGEYACDGTRLVTKITAGDDVKGRAAD